jgi:hypothetical protein
MERMILQGILYAALAISGLFYAGGIYDGYPDSVNYADKIQHRLSVTDTERRTETTAITFVLALVGLAARPRPCVLNGHIQGQASQQKRKAVGSEHETA